MRQLILNLAVSLDGYIEGPNGEYDWCFAPPKKEMEEFMNRIDAVFYGRKSYELMGGNAFPGKASYVFSNTLSKEPKNATLIKGDIEKEVEAIKKEQGNDIWVFGGASLVTSLLNLGLVDILWLAVHPILLAKGKPLFQNLQDRTQLRMIETKSFPNGLVFLAYEIDTNKK